MVNVINLEKVMDETTGIPARSELPPMTVSDFVLGVLAIAAVIGMWWATIWGMARIYRAFSALAT